MRETDEARNSRNDARFATAAAPHHSVVPIVFTDLGGACSLMLDKHAGVMKSVLAYDPLATLANWDNLRLLDSEVLGEHLVDSVRMRLQHYSPLQTHRRLLTLKRSQ